MQVALIYREVLDSKGNVERIEPIELDANPSVAPKWARLYKLQSPVDEKDKFEYKTYKIRCD